jgi:hypothetical protein
MSVLWAVLSGVLPLVDPAVHEIRDACRLEAIAFRTETDGWVTTGCGQVFRTRDGGAGWETDHRLEDLFHPQSQFQHLTFMRWLNEKDGIAGGYVGGRIFLTHDAGETWHAAALPDAQWVYATFVRGWTVWLCGSSGAIAYSPDGARTWTAMPTPFDAEDRCMSLAFDSRGHGEAAGMNLSRYATEDFGLTWRQLEPPRPGIHTDWRPVPGAQPSNVAVVGRRTITLEGQRIVLEERGARRVQPLLTLASGRRVPLRQVEPRGEGLVGWAEAQVFVSDDRETWFAVSDAPAEPRRVTAVGKEALVLESDVGVFRSESDARDWQKSTQPELDIADADRARGIREAKNPLACVATARIAELKIELGLQGCFGGSSRHWSMTSLGGLVFEGERRSDAATLRTIVDALGEAVTREENPAGWMTTATSAELTWSCDGAAPQTLRFLTHAYEGYTRAAGVHKVIGPRLSEARGTSSPPAP